MCRSNSYLAKDFKSTGEHLTCPFFNEDTLEITCTASFYNVKYLIVNNVK